MVGAPSALAYLRSRKRIGATGTIAVIASIVLLAVVLGRAQQVQYAKHHYTRSSLFLADGGPQAAYDFIYPMHDKKIGISGSGEIFFGQYGYFGADLSNDVQYIGVPARTAPIASRPRAARSATGSTPVTTTTS